MWKDIIVVIFLCIGGVEDIGKFVYQGGFIVWFVVKDCYGMYKKWFYFGRNIFLVVEWVFVDLCIVDIYKGMFWID